MVERIAVMGAGALGGYVGGHLARLGAEVTLVDPWPAHVEAIRAHGLALSGVTEAEGCVVRVPALHITELQAPDRAGFDIAFVAVKSYDTDWATQLIRPYLAPGGYVVSLQNCLNEERIAAVVGWGRTVGCIAATIGVELYEPGRIRRTIPLASGGHATFRVGEPHGRITPRLTRLAALVGGIDSVRATTNLWGERWSKLCVNGMRNGVSAATGLSGNERDRDPALRRFGIRLGAEAVRVGQRLGYQLEDIGGIDPEVLARAGEGDAGAFEQVEARLVAGSNAGARSDLQRPSMAQDIAKGRRTEIDFINGVIVDSGARVGVATPANGAIAALVRRVERGSVVPSPDLVRRLKM